MQDRRKENQPEHIRSIMLRVLSGLFIAPVRIASQDDAGLLSSPGLKFKRGEVNEHGKS